MEFEPLLFMTTKEGNTGTSSFLSNLSSLIVQSSEKRKFVCRFLHVHAILPRLLLHIHDEDVSVRQSFRSTTMQIAPFIDLKQTMPLIFSLFYVRAQILKPDVFNFIEQHNLHDLIRDKVVQLMMIDCKRTVNLLIQQRDSIGPSDVVPKILKARDKLDSRYSLYLYLQSLFEVSPHAGRDFHDMQVELYAEYDEKMLLPFLRSSQHYTLEKACEICVRKGLLKEQVFVLGIMGNSNEALSVIINKLGDMEEVVICYSI